MTRKKWESLNPYERGVCEHSPSLAYSAGQYISVALGLDVLPTIEPEAGENVFAMWLRAFAERGTLWEKLSHREKQGLALDLYFVCFQRAVSLGPDNFAKYAIPHLSEEEFETTLKSLQKRCGLQAEAEEVV